MVLGSLRSEVKHEEEDKNGWGKNGLAKNVSITGSVFYISPDSPPIHSCFMIAPPCGLQLISLWLGILQGRGDQALWCVWSEHLFMRIFSSALSQVHCFDFSMALQYWFWKELVSSELLKVWPLWFLRNLFSLLPHNFILTCHSWNNWHCTLSNWQDAVLKTGGESNPEQALTKSFMRKRAVLAKHCLK